MTYEDKFFKISSIFYFNPHRELYKYRMYDDRIDIYTEYCTLWEDVPHYTINNEKCVFCRNHLYTDYNIRDYSGYTWSNSFPTETKFVLKNGYYDTAYYITLGASFLNIGFYFFSVKSTTDTTITFHNDYVKDEYTFTKVYPANGYKLNDDDVFVNINDDTDGFSLNDGGVSKTPMLVGLYGFQMGRK